MKLYRILLTPDIVLAHNDFEAISAYINIYSIDEEEDIKAQEIPERDMDGYELYDEYGVVNGYPSVVTLRQMYEVESQDWDGDPYIIATLV